MESFAGQLQNDDAIMIKLFHVTILMLLFCIYNFNKIVTRNPLMDSIGINSSRKLLTGLIQIIFQSYISYALAVMAPDLFMDITTYQPLKVTITVSC